MRYMPGVLLLAFALLCMMPVSGSAQEVTPTDAQAVIEEIPAGDIAPIPEEALLGIAGQGGGEVAVSVGDTAELDAEEKALRALAAQLARHAPRNIEPSERIDAVSDMVSLFFTRWQYIAIQDARNSRGFVRPLSGREREQVARQSPNMVDDDFLPVIVPGVRNIRLGGILYTSADDWTIWLNDQRVTPKALPEEVLDLRVYEDHVEMKWVDEYTNQIFPLRLKPHQRFNLDTRIFLPG